MLQAALNGSRPRTEHPGVPRTPQELAADAWAAVSAGAQVLHLHPYDAAGLETLAAEPCAAALRAVRQACPGVPISLSTSAQIEPDPPRRLALIAAWTDWPDLVTVNQGEDGIAELCKLLLTRGVGIEAGLLHLRDAEAFVRSALPSRCVRALVEPMDAEAEAAVAHAAAMEAVLDAADIMLPQVHHGDGQATWAVCARALSRGHGIRSGLEDTIMLPDGRQAAGNAELVRAARAMMLAV